MVGRNSTPTNQKAEIEAIILALEWATQRYEELDSSPNLLVKINSDSRYAVNCMNEWIAKWSRNGWQNSKGWDVANRDLLQRAADLDEVVKQYGTVQYIWIPREKNTLADRYCNDALNRRSNCGILVILGIKSSLKRIKERYPKVTMLGPLPLTTTEKKGPKPTHTPPGTSAGRGTQRLTRPDSTQPSPRRRTRRDFGVAALENANWDCSRHHLATINALAFPHGQLAARLNMSVRVVARIRPLLPQELDKDIIVHAASTEDGKPDTLVRIPSPKNEAEEFTFAFNGVYDQPTTQEELFSAEVAPHLKSLFQGLDVTIFAYGVTGTGKTHTMRGGLKLADRGVIPRLLSGVYRRSKKMMKDSNGETTVTVALSYYEIYNDKVFDLFEPPEKRLPAGLPLREANGKTNVVGLTERPCEDLKDFERLYIEANNNRITAATKLNAHSSRSHAILRVKLTQTTGDMVRESTASAIDLAGSEDNRRTENNKERLVESAAINKSLFVLSQCIDAISRGDRRIPFRESKMTRILSLGQNNGITVMILNLAPLRSYHLDTLSSLNVSSRAKRIEVREIENEIVYKQVPRTNSGSSGLSVTRQPLRPLANAHNIASGQIAAKEKEKAAVDRPVKAFNVYTDRPKPVVPPRPANMALKRTAPAQKRPSDQESGIARPSKITRPAQVSLAQPVKPPQPSVSAEQIEAMVEKKVAEILASRTQAAQEQQPEISEAVQKRLEALERRIDDGRHDDHKSEGLRFLLMARQHKERGEDSSALKMYEMALPYFPGQAKLLSKIDKLKAKIAAKREGRDAPAEVARDASSTAGTPSRKKKVYRFNDDEDYEAAEADDDDESFAHSRKPTRKVKATKLECSLDDTPLTPQMQELLDIINSGDANMIMGLQGFGPKKARDLVDYLDQDGQRIQSLAQLRAIPGMGGRAIDRAYEGLVSGHA
ncbi:hypothetical protein JX266_004631 [Neoarthrinium moseri]|nr:hypothetical protein JX266_004631 [Neoarthrinium moseri]